MKGKRVGKKDANTKTTQQCVIEEETKVFGVKPLHHPPSGNQFTRQSVRIHVLARDLPNLIYRIYLSPPSSYSNKASRNSVLFSSPHLTIHTITSAKAWLLLILPSNTKSLLDTLKGCGKCLSYQSLKDMKMER